LKLFKCCIYRNVYRLYSISDIGYEWEKEGTEEWR